MTRFAAITADLLARKGEAMPWNGMTVEAPPVAWRAAAAAPPPYPSGKDRSCAVRMTAQDFEGLGILAVKMGATRQQLLKQALAQFLVQQARAHACACLGSCDKGCG